MSNKSRDSLSDWFRQWRSPLRRFLSLRGRYGSADLDDIAQEVFLRMLRSDRQTMVMNPQAYLFKIAANVSVEWSTRASSRLPHSHEWLETLPNEGCPEDDYEREAMEHDLNCAVETLPSRTRAILRMHYRDGLTHDEIASQLATTRRVVKRDLIHAYADLRAALSPDQALENLVRRRSPRSSA